MKTARLRRGRLRAPAHAATRRRLRRWCGGLGRGRAPAVPVPGRRRRRRLLAVVPQALLLLLLLVAVVDHDGVAFRGRVATPAQPTQAAGAAAARRARRALQFATPLPSLPQSPRRLLAVLAEPLALGHGAAQADAEAVEPAVAAVAQQQQVLLVLPAAHLA